MATGQTMAHHPPILRIRPARVLGVTLLLATVLASAGFATGTASAQALDYASAPQIAFPPGGVGDRAGQPAIEDESAALPERLRRAVVAYSTREPPGSIVIDTANTTLYYVLAHNRAIRYGVGVGREGFTWSGVKSVARKAEWPDWYPPAEMISRQPYLPRFMAGGPGNPLGARAIYLGNSEYRIHGTNDPSTIGKFVSSGCIRLTNEDIKDLFNRVEIGARVVVLPKRGPALAHRSQPSPQWSPGSLERQALNLSPTHLH